MSERHPIIAITGSSGAGTTSVTRTFDNIFRREGVNAVMIEGDSFHRYNRHEMKLKAVEAEQAGDNNFSHFGPANNLFAEIAGLFSAYAQTGTGRFRKYLHDDEEARPYQQAPGTFTAWEDVPAGTDLLFYEGLHGAVVTPDVNIAPAPRSAGGCGACHQPRVDPEALPRQVQARLQHRGGDRHHPAPHARLRELHLPAVHAHACEFSARADGGHLQPVHRARHSVAGRKHGRDPVRQTQGHRLSSICSA